MSVKEVIEIIKQLPDAEKSKVALYLQESAANLPETKTTAKRMSFEEAKNHVFANYGDLLKKLAQ